MRMISGAWLSMIFNVALAVGVSRRRVLLSSQGDLACGAGWVSSHARNLPSLGAGGHKIQQTHAHREPWEVTYAPCPPPHQPCDNHSR